jgi:hypothetical protein
MPTFMFWIRLSLGLLTVALLLVAGLSYFGRTHWLRGSAELRAGLEAARLPPSPEHYDEAELAGLPPPVQRFFRAALKPGQPIVGALSLEQQGSFNLSAEAEKWKPFTATQRVITRRPGFDWDARIEALPGLPVRVHDAYIGGQGHLHAALFGLFTVARQRGDDAIALGELMRYLAEAAWYPTALLPSQNVRWASVDANSARATLDDGGLSVSLLFSFNAQGLIDTVRAEARGRTVGKQTLATPWQGRFWDYAERQGMQVPLHGEVAWLLPEGARPYWRGEITALAYE